MHRTLRGSAGQFKTTRWGLDIRGMAFGNHPGPLAAKGGVCCCPGCRCLFTRGPRTCPCAGKWRCTHTGCSMAVGEKVTPLMPHVAATPHTLFPPTHDLIHTCFLCMPVLGRLSNKGLPPGGLFSVALSPSPGSTACCCCYETMRRRKALFSTLLGPVTGVCELNSQKPNEQEKRHRKYRNKD